MGRSVLRPYVFVPMNRGRKTPAGRRRYRWLFVAEGGHGVRRGGAAGGGQARGYGGGDQ
jgi:hypothetical protein